MTAVICIVRHPGGTIEVPAGDEATFGRVDADGHLRAGHIGLSVNPRLHAQAGTIAVDESGWTLHNTGRWLHLRVAPVGRADRTDVAPGRSLRVPWSEARVEVVTGDETVGLTVECPVLADDPPAPSLPSGDTVGGLGLDRSAGYFRAAVALCAPRLRDPSSTEVATVAEVARALGGAPGEPERVTQKAVERRLAHLRTRLDIGGEDPTGVSAAGLEVRDAGRQLVDLLIRTGTVTPADLALIGDAVTDAGTPSP